MKIEAYLFVPFRGQYRFAFELHDNNHVTPFTESRRSHDYLWDIRMRTRPTLHELVCPERESIRTDFEKRIREEFKAVQDRVTHSPNSRIKRVMDNAYVEFVHAN